MRLGHYIKDEIKNSRNTIKTLVAAAGSQAPKLRRSLYYGIAESVMSGLALITFYPMSGTWLSGSGGVTFNFSLFLFWAGIFTLLVIAAFLCSWQAQNYQTQGHAIEAAYEARLKLGERLRAIPQEVLSGKESGELNSVLLANVEEAVLFTSFMVRLVASSFIVPLVVTVGTLFFAPRAGLILLMILPVSYALYLWRRPAFQRGFTYLATAVNSMKGSLIQFIQGITVIKSCNVATSQLSQYEKMCAKVRDIQYIGQKKGGKPNLIITSSVYAGLVLLVACGSYWVTRGSLLVTSLAALAVAFTHLSSTFSLLVLYAASLEIFAIGKKNIDKVMSLPLLPVAHHLKKKPKDFSVTYEEVGFRYEGDKKPVLDGINLTIPEKSMTAIVGGSGCGKTTLVKLLCRSMDVASGRILIGGVDIRELPISYLLSLISAVFQEVYLFNDTVYNNIKMGRENATEEEIIAAAKLAECHDFIENLPQGYQTLVGDIGGRLSGGEKQRLSIARALLKDAPIIILDEPTAALDTENEVKVQKALNELIKNKTVIVISHRLSTTTGANQIVVLESGQVTDLGTHQTLLTKPGKYQYYWRLQQQLSEF